MSDEGRLMGGRSPSSSSSSMPALDSQESSWIGLLSRPAMALVEKIRNRTLKSSLVTEESEFLSPLEDVQLGPPHLSYLQCEPRGPGALPWLSADSLREIGLQNGAEVDLSLCQQTQFGYLSSFRAVLGHMLLSSQEVKPPGGQSWSSRPRWDSFWGGKEGSERGQLSRGMLGENAGANDHKEQLVNNGSPPTVQNAVADRQLSIRDPQNCSGSAAALPVTPEQDNGYSSLEEEHLSGVTSASAEPPPPQETDGMEEVVLAVPQCQNKTINFIMGGPCSEDEDSQSEESSDDDDDDDDDGFDSEGSSEMSDGTDDDGDEDDDSEAELEAERLWRSLCHSEDPYDPRNFTARLHSGVTASRAIPVSTSPSSAQSSPSSSPPSSMDTWDDSASASEADEESLRLWDSFSSSSDPFNPLNFQAPIRTRESATARAGKTSAYRRLRQESPPKYRKEEAEDRMDSGFCDTSARNCSSTKKVRFCDDVEEFFASCGEEEEDRRGPWEELARDRCRFLRRCQEVEESIAYCLQPQHRRRVYEQLAALPR
ncbi:hypothetical protein ACER0C_019892 [Sarotherodon galilaeus]